jgi:UDP-N-acetylmuramate: L-alanyl-gamma-D-glutamyl-meso-diaminopimelate ligase
MHLHILGIGGTFMAGIAVIAKQLGHTVTGTDQNLYPPMSTQLAAQNIALTEGYTPDNIPPQADCIIIGNALSRGNPAVEYVLNQNLPYISGPQWLAEQVLRDYHVLAVSGTHGKTTTSSMLAWILQCAGLQPGFLIGGMPENFAVSARAGKAPFFVIEADEYDTAFFDKRAKFVHYHPRTLVINNLEYDHADIFPNLQAIQTQFHHLMRTVPGEGAVIYPAADAAVEAVLARGCWSQLVTFGTASAQWCAVDINADASQFTILQHGEDCGRVTWSQIGLHNVNNALAAIAAAATVGVAASAAIAALNTFQGVARRMQVKAQHNGITVYDDFAHHPSAIASTLQGLRQKVGQQRIIAIVEFSSNTMKSGALNAELQQAVRDADIVYFAQPSNIDWSIDAFIAGVVAPAQMLPSVDAIVAEVAKQLQNGDQLIVLAKSGFDNIHSKLAAALQQAPE